MKGNAEKAAEPGVADKNASAVKDAVTAERERVIGIFKAAGGYTKAAEDAVASGQSPGEFADQLEKERAAIALKDFVNGGKPIKKGEIVACAEQHMKTLVDNGFAKWQTEK